MKSLLELYCDVDDFWQVFGPMWKKQMLETGSIKRMRTGRLSMSEIITIIIHFHQMRFQDFKSYYTQYVQVHLRKDFPDQVSYNRFVPLMVYMKCCQGECSGISFIDSTPLRVCHNRRIKRHKVFDGLAGRGKTSIGWFYGFKLHLTVNDQGQILAVQLTPGNVDDRKPVLQMTKNLFGKLFADKGYVSKTLFATLWQQGIQLVTTIRKSMKNRLMPIEDKILLRKRSIIETIIDQLKNISQIELSRHRSFANFLVNLFAGLVAYSLQPQKPSLDLGYPALTLSLPS